MSTIRVTQGRRSIEFDEDDQEEFWRHVSKNYNEHDCWRWTGSVYDNRPTFCKAMFVLPSMRLAVMLSMGGADKIADKKIKACKHDRLCVNPAHASWYDPNEPRPKKSIFDQPRDAPLELPPALTRLAVAGGQDVPAEEREASKRRTDTSTKEPRKPPAVPLTEAQRVYYFLVQHVRHMVRFKSGSVMLEGEFGKVHEPSLSEAVEKAQAIIDRPPSAIVSYGSFKSL